jgi:hypothetical protein
MISISFRGFPLQSAYDTTAVKTFLPAQLFYPHTTSPCHGPALCASASRTSSRLKLNVGSSSSTSSRHAHASLHPASQHRVAMEIGAASRGRSAAQA